RTVAINAVRTCAQNTNVFARNFLGAVKRELLVAAAGAAVLHTDRNFSAAKQAHSFILFAQIAKARKQMIGGSGVIPVVARVSISTTNPWRSASAFAACSI